MLPGTTSRLLWGSDLAPFEGVRDRPRERTNFERQVLEDLDSHPPVMDPAVREGVALEAHERANLPLWFPTADELAEALGVVVLRDPRALDGQVAFDDGVIAVKPSARYPAHEQLGTFHELAHHLLDGRHHRHGDVWLLALALAIPRDRVGLVGCFKQHLPAWAVEMRVEALEGA